nr:hypothetical protein [Nitrospira japonica]
MTINRKASLLLHELRQFLQGTEHEIGNLTARKALDMVMMLTPRMDLVSHLTIMKTDRIHQSQLFK